MQNCAGSIQDTGGEVRLGGALAAARVVALPLSHHLYPGQIAQST